MMIVSYADESIKQNNTVAENGLAVVPEYFPLWYWHFKDSLQYVSISFHGQHETWFDYLDSIRRNGDQWVKNHISMHLNPFQMNEEEDQKVYNSDHLDPDWNYFNQFSHNLRISTIIYFNKISKENAIKEIIISFIQSSIRYIPANFTNFVSYMSNMDIFQNYDSIYDWTQRQCISLELRTFKYHFNAFANIKSTFRDSTFQSLNQWNNKLAMVCFTVFLKCFMVC